MHSEENKLNNRKKLLSPLNYVKFRVNRSGTRTAFILTNISNDILSIEKIEFLDMNGHPYEQEYMKNELISYREKDDLQPGENLILTKYNTMDFSTSEIKVKLSCEDGEMLFNDSLL